MDPIALLQGDKNETSSWKEPQATDRIKKKSPRSIEQGLKIF